MVKISSTSINNKKKMRIIISSLPTAIFTIIQEYLSDHDYRNVMNCNQQDFQAIKYETVRYIMIMRRWIQFNKGNHPIDNFAAQFKNFDKLISRVKDKSKQIGLKMKEVTLDILKNFSSRFHGINCIEIQKDLFHPFLENVDSLFFSDIHRVQFDWFNPSFHCNIQNVQELTIINANNVDCIIENNQTLKKITLINSSPLSLSSILQYPEIQLVYVFPRDEKFEFLPNISYRSISIKDCERLSLSSLFHRCDLSHLEYLEINEILDREIKFDYSLFSHISRLSLSSSLDSIQISYPMGIFYGKYLTLAGFDLTIWKSSANLPNVIKAEFSRCRLPPPPDDDDEDFFLSNVRIISLSHIPLLTKIKNLFSCRDLQISQMNELLSIHELPKLLFLHLFGCPNLSQIDLLPNQILQEISLYSCRKFHNYGLFKDIYHVSIVTDDGMLSSTDFKNYSQSILPMNKRNLRLTFRIFKSSLQYDLLNITNLYSLDLSFLVYTQRRGTTYLSGIHDIPKVNISDRLETIGGLMDVKNIQLLKLRDTRMLSQFNQLENIDTIMISQIPNDLNLIGLKGCCRVVYSHGNSILEKQAQLYASLGAIKFSPEFQKILDDMENSDEIRSLLELFNGIEEFYVVSKIYDEWPDPSEIPRDHLTRLW